MRAPADTGSTGFREFAPPNSPAPQTHLASALLVRFGGPRRTFRNYFVVSAAYV